MALFEEGGFLQYASVQKFMWCQRGYL